MMKLPQIPTPKNPEKGFTLIELMIVIAIIAILVAIALPAYQTYIRKATFSEVINATSPAKAAITTYFQEQGTLTGFVGAGYNQLEKGNVASINVTNDTAIITATSKAGIGTDISGETVTLTPTIVPASATTEEAITWDCTSSADDKYLPSFCS